MTADVHHLDGDPRDGEGDGGLADLVNCDAEQALLGAILTDNAAAAEKLPDTLEPYHFGDPVNGDIFAACRQLLDAGKSADALTLKRFFERDERLADVGGAAYLVELQQHYVCLMFEDYAEIIIDLWRRRRLHVMHTEGIRAAADFGTERQPTTAADAIELVEARLTEIAEAGHRGRGLASIGAVLRGTIDGIEQDRKAILEGRPIGLPTGLIQLDKTLLIKPGNLIIVGARPGMGKSALASSIAVNVAKRGETVGLWSGEMSAEQIGARILARETRTDLTAIERRAIDAGGMDRLLEAERALRSWPLSIDDQAGLTVAQLRSRMASLQRRRGLALVVVDYLGLLRVPEWAHETRHLDLGQISRALKEMARALAVPVIALHQLNRGLESRDNKRPQLSDLRESGSLEEDADAVLFIYREEYYHARNAPVRKTGETDEKFMGREADHAAALTKIAGKAELIVAKQRQGPLGTAETHFAGARATFENLAGAVPDRQGEMGR